MQKRHQRRSHRHRCQKLKFKLNKGDIVFNRTNSLELVGKTSIFDIDGDYVFASYLIRLSFNPRFLDPYFFNLYFNANDTQIRLKALATRGVSQSNISATRLKGFSIPIPSIGEQAEIVEIFKKLDSKIDYHEKKKHVLTEIFKSMLHQLMAGQIRVHQIDFDLKKDQCKGDERNG